MSTTVQTQHIPVFNGDYYAECLVSWTTNTSNRTITVNIEGFRRYCKYDWNFSSDITLRIATSSSGANAQQVFGATGFPSSTTTGFWPKNGYDTSLHVSKTFNYNDDGTVPDIWIYIRNQNYSIEWVSQGTHHGWDISGNVNIKSQIPAISATVPTVSLSKGSYTATRINWSATANKTIDRWEYRIDNGSWTAYSTSRGTSSSGSANVSSTTHKLTVRGRRAGTNTYGTSSSVTYDCTRPSIYNARITPTSINRGTLSFTSNYDIQYNLSGNSTTWVVAKNTNPNVSVNLTSNSLSSYTLTVARRDNTAITNSTTITNVDSRAPTITLSYKVTGTSCTFTATSNTTCNNWYYTLNGTRYSITSGNTSSVTVTISNLQVNKTYTLIVYATKVSNGIRGNSPSAYPKAVGCARIFDGGTTKSAAVYIYINGRWNAAIPYVWDNGRWKMGT